MSKAVVVIKSSRAETYVNAFTQLLRILPDLSEIVWVYFRTDRISEVIPNRLIPARAESTESVAATAADVTKHLTKAEVIDVSGLPKEDFIQLVPLLVGRRNLKAFTLTMSPQGSAYIDLLSDPTIAAFRRSHLGRLLLFRLAILVIAGGTVGLIVVYVIKAVPDASLWATWLGVFLGIVGLGMSFLSLRRG